MASLTFYFPKADPLGKWLTNEARKVDISWSSSWYSVMFSLYSSLSYSVAGLKVFIDSKFPKDTGRLPYK